MEPILKIEHLSVSFTQYDRGARRRQLHVVKRSVPCGYARADCGGRRGQRPGKVCWPTAFWGILPYNSRAEGPFSMTGSR